MRLAQAHRQRWVHSTCTPAAQLKAESLIGDEVTEDTIRHAISAVTEQPALESDVQRIEEHLASVGWVVEPAKDS